MIVRHLVDVDEINFEETPGLETCGTRLRWLIDRSVGSEEQFGHSFALRHFVMEPGASYPLHKHKYVEAVFVLSGKVQFGDAEQWYEPVSVGDVVYTARWEAHRLRNPSLSEQATFLCTIELEAGRQDYETPIILEEAATKIS